MALRGLAQSVLKLQPALTRGLQSEAARTRYSPTPFSRTKPHDVSASWLPKNPFVESWVHRRNQLHEHFAWDARTTFEAGYYLIGLTAAFCVFGTWTLRSSDAANNYPRRDLVTSGSNTGFILPDEREWY